MAKVETRIEKYKEYRDSIIKEGMISLDSQDEIGTATHVKESGSTTTALPLEQVMGIMQSDKEEVARMKKQKLKKVLKILIPCLCAALLVAGLIVFGVIVFGGK